MLLQSRPVAAVHSIFNNSKLLGSLRDSCAFSVCWMQVQSICAIVELASNALSDAMRRKAGQGATDRSTDSGLGPRQPKKAQTKTFLSI